MFICSLKLLCLAALAALLVASCKDVPGADGRYARDYKYLYAGWAP
jgi:hypothetical protein